MSPQDGGFTHRFGQSDQSIDVRLASLPTKYGERMTVRLLALQTESLTLERLGMSERDLVCFSEAIEKPHGLILLTGPTGSGKTTTLYAALRRLIGGRELNVITIEDPIEYGISGVAQVEVDTADKVTFGKALRSVLRHDPDVVMIGEIRDAETADVAIKAALTGHLVFSTLHTNSAPSVVTRLVDMGVERYLIAATLRLAVAQRLVRRLCARCRRERELLPSEAAALGNPAAAGAAVYEPAGCLYLRQSRAGGTARPVRDAPCGRGPVAADRRRCRRGRDDQRDRPPRRPAAGRRCAGKNPRGTNHGAGSADGGDGVVNGQLSVVSCQWSVVSGQWAGELGRSRHRASAKKS